MRAVFLLLGLLLAVLLPLRLATTLLFVCCLLPMIALRGRMGLCGWLSLGVICALIWQANALSRWPPAELTQSLMVEGQVVNLPDTAASSQRFLFRPTTIESVDWRLPRRIRVTIYHDDLRVQAGEHWRLPLKIRRPRGFMNPVRFDYEQWLAGRKIDATATVDHTQTARLTAPAQGIHAWRAAVSADIAANVDAAGGRALLQGLVTGDRRGFTDSMWDVLRTTGTSHLLAISGLHIGLMAGFGYGIARIGWRWLPLPGNRRVWAVAFGVAFAAAYAALAGFSVPTIRALSMLLLGALALLCRVRVNGFRVLLTAAIGLLLLEPSTALMPGAWLSFAAVALILVLIRRRALGPLNGLWVLQLGLLVGLMPLTAIFFGSFSPLALPINLVVLPVFSFFVVPAALLSTGLLWVSEPAGGWALDTLGNLLERLYQWGVWLLEAGAAPVALGPSAALMTLLAFVGVGLFVLPAGLPMRGLAWVLLMPVILAPVNPLPYGDARITWLEVGQGNAAVIETRHHTVVIDTGPAWWGGGHAAAFTLIPYLKQRGIEQIDRLIITHADADHRGGLQSIVEAFTVIESRVGEPLSILPDAKPCVAGERWELDGVPFQFLAPTQPFAASGNAASCVTGMGPPGARVLFTGDIEGIEEYSVAMRAESAFAVVEAPHHGSRSSSSAVFLARTEPDHVIISAGYRNAYQMPHPEVVERVLCAGAQIHDTGLDGAITFRLKQGKLIPQGGERKRRARILNAPLQVGRFRDGEEILYHRGPIRFMPAGIQQRLCKN